MLGRSSFERMTLGAANLALLLAGCSGTEHRLFTEIPRTNVEPLEPRAGAGAGAAAEPEAGGGGGPADSGVPMDAEIQVEPGPRRDPNLDPGVSFDWTETLPGKGTCRQGLYIGRYECKSQGDAGIQALINWTGQLVFTLRGSMEEQILMITEGFVTDDLIGAILSSTRLEGSLDCLNDQRFEAHTINGYSLILGDYETTLTGNLDVETLVIAGTFEIVGMNGDRWACSFQTNAAP